MEHARQDFLPWEQHVTCCHCGKPLADNQQMKDALKTNTTETAGRADPFVMPDDAVALQPVRYIGTDSLRYYTAMTFPENPRSGCDMYYRRCRVFGGISKNMTEEAGVCDVLNNDGDIIADFPLTKKGLNYLYRALGCRVEA